MGLYWCWSLVTAWVCLLGIAFLLRFLFGPWRSMRVIEKPDIHLHAESGEPERCPGAAS
jgi:hypothetical protein